MTPIEGAAKVWLRMIRLSRKSRFFSFARRTAIAAFAAAILICAHSARADESSVYKQNIDPSLAFVISYDQLPSGLLVLAGTGTAFCIYSDKDTSTSYFLTENHVVQDHSVVKLVLARRPGVEVPVDVFDHRGGKWDPTQPDIAILRARIGNVPAVQLAPIIPTPLTRIAIAGYPRSDIAAVSPSQLLAISPSAAAGFIASETILKRFYIKYEKARTEHGNSGGPLFDLTNGAVYGMADQLLDLPAKDILAQAGRAKDLKTMRKLIGEASKRLAESDVPPALATSMKVAIPLLQTYPEIHYTIADSVRDQYNAESGGTRGGGLIDITCERGMDELAKAYEEWTYYRSILKPIYAVANASIMKPQLAHQLSSQANAVTTVDLALEKRINSAVATIASSDASHLVSLARGLARSVKSADAQDKLLVAALAHGRPPMHAEATYQNTASQAAQIANKLAGRPCVP